MRLSGLHFSPENLSKRVSGIRVPPAVRAKARLALAACAIIAGLLAQGCAYRAGMGDRQIPGGYRAIAVPVFKNMTFETGVETYFTNAMIREIERARVGKITDKSDAQVVLEGTVDSVRYVGGNTVSNAEKGGKMLPNNTVLNLQYRILLTTTLRLRRAADQKILWEQSFNGERSYDTPQVAISGLNSVNATYNHSARYQNIQQMASDMMTEAHSRLTENF